MKIIYIYNIIGEGIVPISYQYNSGMKEEVLRENLKEFTMTWHQICNNNDGLSMFLLPAKDFDCPLDKLNLILFVDPRANFEVKN
jgi:hypothetical protein